MNPDNEYYSMHAEAFKRLRKDVRKMDEDIRLDETILIDHKQTATKVWMRLNFGGLHEWSIWQIRVRWTIFGRRRRRDTSFSESNAGPSRFHDQPPPSQWQQQQQPTPSQLQNSYQYPVHMRPPIPSESGYPPQDPLPQDGRKHLASESLTNGGIG